MVATEPCEPRRIERVRCLLDTGADAIVVKDEGMVSSVAHIDQTFYGAVAQEDGSGGVVVTKHGRMEIALVTDSGPPVNVVVPAYIHSLLSHEVILSEGVIDAALNEQHGKCLCKPPSLCGGWAGLSWNGA